MRTGEADAEEEEHQRQRHKTQNRLHHVKEENAVAEAGPVEKEEAGDGGELLRQRPHPAEFREESGQKEAEQQIDGDKDQQQCRGTPALFGVESLRHEIASQPVEREVEQAEQIAQPLHSIALRHRRPDGHRQQQIQELHGHDPQHGERQSPSLFLRMILHIVLLLIS